MSNQQHTPEPWRANDAQADIDGPNGEPVAVCYCNDDKGDDAIANARRIVACVNACAGLDTELVEQFDVAGAFQTIHDLEQQRDEMISAFESVSTSLRKAGASIPAPENKGTIESAMATGMSIALLLVEDVISSVKGGAK